MAEATRNLLEKLRITGSNNEGVPPKEPSDQELQELRRNYIQAGQDHVFTFYDQLDTNGKATLFEQLSTFDPNYINDITHNALVPPKKSNEEEENKLEPLPNAAVASIFDSKKEDIESWYSSGLSLIAEGKVAVVLMAGGQGTRLGSSAPKGCFDIGLPSHKSLFQIQAERIYKIQQLAKNRHGQEKVVVPWYIMTSGPTRGPTEKFFQEHNYFGLAKDDVVIFEQGVLPCVSNEGKILLESKSKVCKTQLT